MACNILSAILFLCGVLFLFGSSTISDNYVVHAQEHEVKIKADIEQENKCEKDSDCDNENEVNDSLNDANIHIQNFTNSENEQTTLTCETCFTDNLDETEINQLESTIFEITSGQDSTIEDLCNLLRGQFIANEEQLLINLLTEAGLSNDKAIIVECLKQLGILD